MVDGTSLEPTLVVIGGGFSGVMLAAHLVRRVSAPCRVVLVERRPPAGRGVAYATSDDRHLLNVPAARMSAWPDQPEHFLKWLTASGNRPDAVGSDFIPRREYGAYLRAQLAEAAAAAAARPGITLEVLEAEALWVTPPAAAQRATVGLADGSRLEASAVTLALGHFPPAHPPVLAAQVKRDPRYVGDPWSPEAVAPVSAGGDVLLIGGGLTAIDLALAIEAKGPVGRIHLLSRSGRLPQPHRASGAWQLTAPLPTHSVRALVRAVREEVARADAAGVDWRGVLDALRPQTQAIWRALPPAERQRFLRHVRSFWEPHRHRLPPPIASSLELHVASGAWQVLPGRLTGVRVHDDALMAQVRPRGGGAERMLRVARIVNCTGPKCDARRMHDALIADLLRRGLVVPDALGLGLETDRDGALVSAAGEASDWLYTLGPQRKGQLWETTAVPELRGQAAALAERLAGAVGRL